MEDDIRSKSFPENYSSDAVRVLDTMSFTKGKSVGLLGSMSLRSQLYAGDYDAFEIVNLKETSDTTALHTLAVRFKEIVKEMKDIPKTFIGDIKAGSIEEWRVLPKTAKVKDGKLEGMDVVASRKVLDSLKEKKVISPNEYRFAYSLLKGKMTPIRFLEAKQKLKFHIVRWSVEDVLRGEKRLRDGRIFTLEEAFSSPSITKMDVISYVQNNRYTDFSMIYYFRNNGKLLNPDLYDFVDSIKENILYYTKKGNLFKVLKRKFALAKFERNAKVIETLTPILNSDLGRLYHIVGDIGTLIRLLEDERPNLKSIRFEIDQFRNRLANVYTLSDYLKEEHTLLGQIEAALREPKKEQLLAKLRSLEDRIENLLNTNTKRVMKGKKLKGGAIDIEYYFPPNQYGNKRIVEDTYELLKDLAHFYTYRNPPMALGFRVLADDLWSSLPLYDGYPKRPSDEGHMRAQEFKAKSSLGIPQRGDPFVHPTPRDRILRDIQPLVNQVMKPSNPGGIVAKKDKYGYDAPPSTYKQAIFALRDRPDLL